MAHARAEHDVRRGERERMGVNQNLYREISTGKLFRVFVFEQGEVITVNTEEADLFPREDSKKLFKHVPT